MLMQINIGLLPKLIFWFYATSIITSGICYKVLILNVTGSIFKEFVLSIRLRNALLKVLFQSIANVIYLYMKMSYQQFNFFTFSMSETLVRATIISSDNFTMLNVMKSLFFIFYLFTIYCAL